MSLLYNILFCSFQQMFKNNYNQLSIVNYQLSIEN